MSTSKEIEFKVGRRTTDGTVRLSTYLPHLLTLSISYKGERATSVVLTHGQMRQLQRALAELEPVIGPDELLYDQWNGQERRTTIS